MNKKLLTIIGAVCLGIASLAQAQDGSIGVYLDAAGTQCDGTAMPGTPLDGSVWVNLAGSTTAGITGAEFRIDPADLTGDYVYVATSNPVANIVLGDPFNSLGVNIGFPTCQDGATNSGRVQLFTFQVVDLSPSASQNNWLTLRQRFTPTNPNFRCALVTLCDSPAFTKVCLSAPDSDHWRAVVNPGVGVSGNCSPVAVEEGTWSKVKDLYRN